MDTKATTGKRKVLSMKEILAVSNTKYGLAPWGDGMVRIGTLSAGAMMAFVEQNEGPAK